MSRQAGSIVRGCLAAPEIREKGRLRVGRYVLPGQGKVKVQPNRPGSGVVAIFLEINGLGRREQAGRSGRARTYDPRFWRPVLYQLSYTPKRDKSLVANPRP